MAATLANGKAVALAEHSAAFVLFQRQPPSFPLHKNANSAHHSLTSACHFGGSIAICAANAVTTATDAVGESILLPEISGFGSPSLYTERKLGGEVLNSPTTTATLTTF